MIALVMFVLSTSLMFFGFFLSCYHGNTTEVRFFWGKDNCPPKFRQNSGNCVFNL